MRRSLARVERRHPSACSAPPAPTPPPPACRGRAQPEHLPLNNDLASQPERVIGSTGLQQQLHEHITKSSLRYQKITSEKCCDLKGTIFQNSRSSLVLERPLISSSHLYAPVQQLICQRSEGGTAFTGETGQPAEETRCTRVPDHVTGMNHVQCLKVIIDGVAHNHFAFKYTEDLR